MSFFFYQSKMFRKIAPIINSVPIDSHHGATTPSSERDLFFESLDNWEKQLASGLFSTLTTLRIKDTYDRKSATLDLRHLGLTDLPDLSYLTELKTLYLDKAALKNPGVLNQVDQLKNSVLLSINSDTLLTQTAALASHL